MELGASGEQLDVRAKIVRAGEGGLAGLRLERLVSAERDRLVRWLAQRQGEALAELKDR